jgi:hypothetical protein
MTLSRKSTVLVTKSYFLGTRLSTNALSLSVSSLLPMILSCSLPPIIAMTSGRVFTYEQEIMNFSALACCAQTDTADWREVLLKLLF